jgi:hypothetical protein
MFNTVVLDVVVGLVFVYLLYSLLATTLQEIIASAFNFRAKVLERAIFRMLEDESRPDSRFRSVFDLFKKTGHGGDANSTSARFYGHPLIKFLGENKRNSKPSYINKETFAKVIIDLLRGDQVKPGTNISLLIQKALDDKTVSWGYVSALLSKETLSYINSIWVDAQGNVDTFKIYLENWFDATMERATGWYKKNVQVILFFIGLALAVIFNIDTLKIAGKLEKDPELRAQIVQQADAFIKSHPDLNKQLFLRKAQYDSLLAQSAIKDSTTTDSIRDLRTHDSLEIVRFQWLKTRQEELFRRADSLTSTDIKKVNDVLAIGWGSNENRPNDAGSFLKALLGWIITALAISLGAPFWFDLLNKLMKIRSSVSSSSPDDKQKK